jgi:hypothetical protein
MFEVPAVELQSMYISTCLNNYDMLIEGISDEILLPDYH